MLIFAVVPVLQLNQSCSRARHTTESEDHGERRAGVKGNLFSLHSIRSGELKESGMRVLRSTNLKKPDSSRPGCSKLEPGCI